MTLNASGPLSLGGNIPGQSIALELGRVGTPISFNDADVRALAGIPSGPISLNNFYGKTAGGGGGGGGGGGVLPGPQPGAAWISPVGDVQDVVSTSQTVAQCTILFANDGTASYVTQNGVVTNPANTGPLKNWAPTTPGIGSSYWARLTGVTSSIEYHGSPGGMSDGVIPITITTMSGSTTAGFPTSYQKRWDLSMAPGVWMNLGSGISLTTRIYVPGSTLVCKDNTFTLSGTIQFAASSGGTVIYQDAFQLVSVTNPY